jgi:regulator of protease activity HflC (stomatin/prohibitin superfamily)
MNSYLDQHGEPRFFKIGAHAVILILALTVVFGSFGTVEAGSRGIKTRFSAVVGVVDPGLYFKLPWVEDVKEMDVRTQTIQYDRSEDASNAPLAAASRDLQDVAVSTVVNYHVDPTQAAEIFKQYRSTENYTVNVVEPLVRDSIKAAASSYTAEELVTRRAEFNDQATKLLAQRLEGKLVVLERVNITDLQFSKAFTDAIESKVTAVQQAEAAKNKLAQVEYEKQQRIAQAEGEAEAIRIQAQAVTQQGGKDYVELQRIQKWNGAGCTSYCGLDTSTGLLISR